MSDFKERLDTAQRALDNSWGSWLLELAEIAQGINVSKGFDSDAQLIEFLKAYDGVGFREAAKRLEELNLAVQVALVADEAFEAMREHRRREPDDKMFDELGDVLIRVLGIFGKHERDPGEVIFRILNNNLKREHKHGGRRY